MMMLNDRQSKILERLVYSTLPITLSEFVEMLSVSERTVKYDISSIREYLMKYNFELKNRRGRGYYIDLQDKDELSKIVRMDQVNIESEVIRDVVYLLLINDNISVNELADIAYISESNVRKVFKMPVTALGLDLHSTLNVRDYIKKVDIFEKRKMFVELMVNNLDSNTLNAFRYQDLPLSIRECISLEYYANIKNVLNRSRERNNVWFSNYAYINVLLYLLICILNIRNTKTVHIDYNDNYSFVKDEVEFSKDVLKNLVPGFYSQDEIYALVDVLVTNGAFVDSYDNQTDTHFQKIIDEMICSLNNFAPELSFNRHSLKKDLSLHLHQFLKKQFVQIGFEDNPMLEHIKLEYEYYYQLAEKIYLIFSKAFDLPYSASEIGYIAIYLYKNRIEEEVTNYRVLVICATGRGLSKLLQKRIESVFSNITVIDVLSSYHLLKSGKYNDIDFIISTVPLNQTQHNVVVTSPFIGKKDIQNIQEYINFGGVVSVVPKATFSDMQRNELQTLSIRQDTFLHYSNIFLKLYDCLMELPSDSQLSESSILSLTIHLIVAMPRIVSNEQLEVDTDLIREIRDIERDYPEIANVFRTFFAYLEEELDLKLPYEERYAFYQYIITER